MTFIKVIGVAVASFAATNLDDLFLLMMFFALASTATERRSVVMGQYFGIAILTGASMAISFFIRRIPGSPERYLGFVPLAIGAVELIRALHGEHDGHLSNAGKVRTVSGLAVMSLCLSDGADNLSVYVPLFSRFPAMQMAVIAVVFMAMTGVWCAAGFCLGQVSPVKRIIRKWENILVPIVMIFVGLMLIL